MADVDVGLPDFSAMTPDQVTAGVRGRDCGVRCGGRRDRGDAGRGAHIREHAGSAGGGDGRGLAGVGAVRLHGVRGDGREAAGGGAGRGRAHREVPHRPVVPGGSVRGDQGVRGAGRDAGSGRAAAARLRTARLPSQRVRAWGGGAGTGARAERRARVAGGGVPEEHQRVGRRHPRLARGDGRATRTVYRFAWHGGGGRGDALPGVAGLPRVLPVHGEGAVVAAAASAVRQGAGEGRRRERGGA